MQTLACTHGQASPYKASLAQRIEQTMRAAAHGCGLSDVLYAQLLQDGFAGILAAAPASERTSTLASLKRHGYDSDFRPFEAGPGECGLTGIDVNCCPCGRHP